MNAHPLFQYAPWRLQAGLQPTMNTRLEIRELEEELPHEAKHDVCDTVMDVLRENYDIHCESVLVLDDEA